jgi:DNA-binding GntR family transcriptional regulator
MMDTKNIKLNLSRETLVDRIVDLLENRILTGELLPGTKLSELGVANDFGVSRAPAREALQRLQEMNLVQKTHNGREVAQFSPKKFREIYELKNVVEAYGAMKGALAAKGQDLNKIQSIIDKMKHCTNSENVEELRRLNVQFHDLLVYCSGNREVIDTYALLAKQVRWAALSLTLPQRPVQSTKEHLTIFEAFRQRDANGVRILLEGHTNASMERILSQLKQKEKKES